jgi:hypothetical protein
MPEELEQLARVVIGSIPGGKQALAAVDLIIAVKDALTDGGGDDSSGEGDDETSSDPVEALANSSIPDPRISKNFTPKGKAEIDKRNADRNGGTHRCDKCGVEVVPGKKSEKGVTPPANEKHRDHIQSKADGGAGVPENGRVLCRTCNLEKGAKSE